MKRLSLSTIGVVIFAVACFIDSLSRDKKSPDYVTVTMMLVGAVLMLVGFRKARPASTPPTKSMSTLVFILCGLAIVTIVPLLSYYYQGMPLRVVILAAIFGVLGFAFLGVRLKKEGKLR